MENLRGGENPYPIKYSTEGKVCSHDLQNAIGVVSFTGRERVILAPNGGEKTAEAIDQKGNNYWFYPHVRDG